ncbi:hypothetical protein BKA70DRAFT_1491265 [Coprinopsis sp. MPI-PUGE-AT-0042]|nr:hypothetical protein BKA70DRAFT_1491265 [Coprinopsis sp. MPI-PUGE-AT-0042]
MYNSDGLAALKCMDTVIHAQKSPGQVLQRPRTLWILARVTQCEIIKWSIILGAQIPTFDSLCEDSSNETRAEITSPSNGVVKTLLVQEGEIAKVGGGVYVIQVDSEEAAAGAGSAIPPPLISATQALVAPEAASTRPFESESWRVSRRKTEAQWDSQSLNYTDTISDCPKRRTPIRKIDGLDESAFGKWQGGRIKKSDVAAAYMQSWEGHGTTYGRQWRRASRFLTMEIPPCPVSRSCNLLPPMNMSIPRASRIELTVNPDALLPAPQPTNIPNSGK